MADAVFRRMEGRRTMLTEGHLVGLIMMRAELDPLVEDCPPPDEISRAS
jgi:hypothetical protein